MKAYCIYRGRLVQWDRKSGSYFSQRIIPSEELLVSATFANLARAADCLKYPHHIVILLIHSFRMYFFISSFLATLGTVDKSLMMKANRKRKTQTGSHLLVPEHGKDIVFFIPPKLWYVTPFFTSDWYASLLSPVNWLGYIQRHSL